MILSFILVRCIQYLDFLSGFLLDFYVNRFIWYGGQSDRVTSDLVSISVIKSIYVLFCTIGGKAIGIRLSHASRMNLDSWRTAQ